MASLGNTLSVHGGAQRAADVSPEQVPISQNSCSDSEHRVSFKECSDNRRPVHSGTGDHRFTQLVSTIEGEIIPRLMLVHRSATDIPAARSGIAAIPSPEEVAELAKIAVEQNADAALAYIEAIRARGISFDTLFLDLLAPAARHLGESWDADLCDFTQVTIGLWRLQQILRTFGRAFENDYPEHGSRALLVAVPGEQHTFGIFMVAEFFRRAGWDVYDAPVPTNDDLLEVVRSEAFDIVGLSAGRPVRQEGLASLIRAIRRISLNRSIGVLVGGPAFKIQPELATLVGADATAVDGREAVTQSQDLIRLLARC